MELTKLQVKAIDVLPWIFVALLFERESYSERIYITMETEMLLKLVESSSLCRIDE